MSIFNKDKSKRKEKRGIVPVAPPAPSYWETYETPADEVTYETPASSYDRSPTTYDTPAPERAAQSYDTSSSSTSDPGGSW